MKTCGIKLNNGYRAGNAGTLLALGLAMAIWVAVVAGSPAWGSSPTHDPAQLVQLLGNDAYQTRLRARRRLAILGPTQDVRDALVGGLESESLEIKQTCRSLLDEFDLAAFDQQLQRLLRPDIDPTEITLPGWQRFAKICGSDRWSRQLFSQIARRHLQLLRNVDAATADRSPSRTQRSDPIDPYRLSGDNVVDWAVLLFVDSVDNKVSPSDLSTRILNSLSHSGLGPKPNAAGQQQLVQRLVEHWLIEHPNTGTIRDQMLVAMRYRCQSRARQLVARTLAEESSSASAQATAMLCASVLTPNTRQQELIARLDDDRTAHVWQLIASRKTKIRTQVRDVALAVLLHQAGIDPRQVGFSELQADPLTLYRDHSLGFANDQQRTAAHKRGRDRLGI